MDHLSAVLQEPQPRNTAQLALADMKQTVLEERRREGIHSGADLTALRNELKQKKGYGG